MTTEELQSKYPSMPIVTITTRHNKPITFPLGRNHAYNRETGAITLSCALSCVLPFKMEIDLNLDGSWQLRSIDPISGQTFNNYLHIDPHQESKIAIPPTSAQVKTVADWFLRGETRPFGIESLSTGGTLQGWAFQGLSRDDVERIAGTTEPIYYSE